MSKNSIMDQRDDNRHIVIHGRTIGDILDHQLVLTSNADDLIPYWITQEEAKRRKQLIELFYSNDIKELKGMIMVYGTAGDDKVDGNELLKMFYNPQNYGFMEKGKEEDKKEKNIFIPAYPRKEDKSMDGL